MAEKESVEAARPPSLVAKVWEAINRDGHLAAFGRQGADELAMALKAFPESIGVDEPGALWNPTQGEIAADRKRPSPSEVAKDKQPYSPEHSHGNDDDHGRGR
jgi:hypothetical protein